MHIPRPKDETLTRILQRAQFIKRGIDLWVNVPQAFNVGDAVKLLEIYDGLQPFDDEYDEDMKSGAERVIARW